MWIMEHMLRCYYDACKKMLLWKDEKCKLSKCYYEKMKSVNFQN